MKDYIVYLSDGVILEQQAFDSKTLYESVKYLMRQLNDDSYYKAAFGIHSELYPWQLGAVCYLKNENGDRKFVWAMHGDVFFGYDFYAKRSDQLIHFLREIFIDGFYNDKAVIENVII